MRLQLDSAVANPLESNQTGSVSAAGPHGGVRGQHGSGLKDSVAVSGVSAALNASSTARAARIKQLSAVVASGSYQVSSLAISAAIVKNAIA